MTRNYVLALAATCAVVCPCISLVVDAQTSRSTVQVTIDEWAVPSAKAHPHDPASSPDGGLWYTGQQNNTLGRVDMATGQGKEFPLPTPRSGPHGIVADTAGNIWYTGNTAAHIGKLDPKTGQVTEYKMPD